MKKCFILLFLLISFTYIYSQEVVVKGQLFGEAEDEFLPYATITVSKDAELTNSVKKLPTDGKGFFETKLLEGDYYLAFQYVGKTTLVKQISIPKDGKELDLGKIVTMDSSTELDEVSVVAQAPLVKVEIDKLTYNLKDDPESATSSVLDMLRKVPLITVDADENVQLKGGSNFKIYLNGKPSNMLANNPSEVLKSMPANSIKDVEVITDPGAKYDAEGVGGIINIVTDKRVDDGYVGSVGAGVDSRGAYNGNAYLTTKYGKFGFTGNVNYFTHKSPDSESTFERRDFSMQPETILRQDGVSGYDGDGVMLSGLISYEIDTLNLISLSLNGYRGNGTNNTNTNVNSSGRYIYDYDRISKSTNERGSIDFSADYQRSFKRKGEFLTLSYRYGNNPNSSDGTTETLNVEGTPILRDEDYKIRNHNEADGNEHTGQIDYVNPLTKNHTIEAGLKYIYRDNSSEGNNLYYDLATKDWLEDFARKNDLQHDQYIASGYVSYGFKKDKFGLKAGLRAEQTKQDVNFISRNDSVIKTDFFDMVPSLALSYQMSMTQTLRLGYNMRVYRPGIWHLNPYIDNIDPLNISYGNPDLDAEKNHNLSLNYGSFSQKLNLNASINYSITNNSITQYQFVENGVNNSTYDNIGKSQSIGLNAYIRWAPTKELNMFINGNGDYIDISSNKDASLKNSGFSYRAFSGVTYTFPHEIRFSVNGGYFGSRIMLQSEMDPFFFMSFGLSKSFLNKKLDVAIRGSNPFQKYMDHKNYTTGANFTQESLFRRPAQSVSLNVTFRFGDLKSSVKKVQRGIINEDIKSGGDDMQGQGATTQDE
ncbi:MAG: TonB-dependent receptor [Bacteroidales bacterium]|nr:TonB-dependent receptor [Bacteroidales bacterium]